MKTDSEYKDGGAGAGKAWRVALLYSMLLFAAAWAVWGLCTPLMGDDLSYTLRSRDLGMSLLTEPRFAWGIWNNCNARMGDMLIPLWLYFLPRAVTALLLGAGAFAAIWGMMRLGLAGRRAPLVAAVSMLLIYTVLPWWDMDFYVCHFNYVWGTALCSLALIPLLEGRLGGNRWLWALPLVFVAVAMHEALGFSLGCGLVVYWYVNRRSIHLSRVQKWWVGAMLAGALFCVTSPASYQRAGSAHVADLPLHLQFLKTLPLCLLLWARVAWLAYKRKIGALAHTRWLIFAVAATVSSGFTLISGIEGRAGWYAQTFALMALVCDFSALEARRHAVRMPRYMPLVLALICNVYVVWFGIRLMEMTGRRQFALALYMQAPDSPMAHEAVEALGNPWITQCMPLTVGRPLVYNDLYYLPLVKVDENDNPAIPVIES